MALIRKIIVAFSMYSQIPMPRFEWQEKDMKHIIVFLPWVGAVIGILTLGLMRLAGMIVLPEISTIAIYSLVPLLVTGGFHIDGYMDVQDAIRSYKSPEEKLEILKDPHIGAFAVIRLMIFGLIWVGAMAIVVERGDTRGMYAYCIMFFVARSITGITSCVIKSARSTGMLNMEVDKSSRLDCICCFGQAIIALLFLICMNPVMGIAICIVIILHTIVYKRMCIREFGGVTGDTAGYNVVTLEEWILVAIAVYVLI